MKNAQERPQYDQLNRLEITIAEILRLNYPGSISDDAGNLWFNMVDDLSKMLGSGKTRFDMDQFLERCWGEEW